jgi:hypothetical protein
MWKYKSLLEIVWMLYQHDLPYSTKILCEENLGKTTLTAFFEFNSLISECLIPEKLFPEKCTWIAKNKTWKLRQARFTTIGRVHIIQPVMQELYFLRTLMSSNHGAGKKSFEDNRTVLDIPYDTYREACVALGFLDDDNEWDLVMTESAACGMPSKLRATRVILLVFNEAGHPTGLFDKHCRGMGEYVVHRLSSEEHPLSDEHVMVYWCW